MNKCKAFTIIELLTSMVIIVLLVGILLPSITMVRRMAKETAQKTQFAAIDMALDAFKQDYGDYPPSDRYEGINPPGRIYCGAQKLTEALLGCDLQGFDPNTDWRRDGYTGNATPIGGNGSYDPLRQRVRPDGQFYTLFERRGPYLEVAKANVFRLGNSPVANANDGLYDLSGSSIFDVTYAKNFIICDVFNVKKITITAPTPPYKVISTTTAGSPILYYRANTSSKTIQNATPANNIYDYTDNLDIIQLGKLPDGGPHTLGGGTPAGSYFYNTDYKIIDGKIFSSTGRRWPNRPDSYILISAGADHEFGTKDDILNF
ncbi:MAG: type II secretion system GspH family protein [Sedimentisphaerales bacterium]|nr:type II secretion system GspH family protein [Sedimentisphaerales bacterium]